MTGQPGVDWLDTEVGQALAADLVARARKNYRIGEAEALAIVREALGKQSALQAAVAAGQTVQQVERTRLFKDVASATRKQIYYHLRRYDRSSPDMGAAAARLAALDPGEHPGQELLDTLAAGHVSTAERLPNLAEFHQALFAHIGTPASVLDLGCGLYPLVFPFDREGSTVSTYAGADKDEKSLSILESYARVRADGRLLVAEFDIGEGWARLAERTQQDRFDVAFLFKLVPVVARQDRNAYQVLSTVPADLVVMTGAVKSMTKNRSIERRERGTLLSFARDAGLVVQAECLTGDECLIVAARQR